MGAKMMKYQVQPALAAVLLSSAMTLGLSSEGLATDAPSFSDESVAGSYFRGKVKVGGIVFIDRPPLGDRAKFEEYGETPEGFVLKKLYLEYGTNDGRQYAQFLGTDIFQNDRNLYLEVMQPGLVYVAVEWDETPHLLSTSSRTLHTGAGTSTLTVDDGVQTALAAAAPAARGAIIEANLRPVTLEVNRETGKFGVRYTPTDEWDIQFNYSHEDKTGQRWLGANLGFAAIIEIPEPINTTTQNFGASIQYTGNIADGRNWTFNLAYAGSIFENANDSVSWENPFTAPNGFAGRHGLPPDNQAHRVTLQTAVDVAEDTKFTGVVSYNHMTQNEAFLPWTINPAIVAPALPAASLNGEINTLLINPKLTTRALHPDLTVTGQYRYHSTDNNTPELLFPDRVRFDQSLDGTDRVALAQSYTKQNADINTVWRAHDWATLGLLLGWEQYDRDRREADITDEHFAKATADLMPIDWLTVRSSLYYGQRRYNDYNYAMRVGRPSHNDLDDGDQHPLMRKYDMNDRDRTKLNLSAEAAVFDGLTFTLLGGVRNDDFKHYIVGGEETLGLLHDRSWHAGGELAYMMDEHNSVFVSYIRENIDRSLRNRQSPPDTPARNWFTDMEDVVDTVTAGANLALIPDSLFLKLGYTYAKAVGSWFTYPAVAGGPTSAPQFPDVTNTYQRFDAVLKYKFDEDHVRNMGWSGDIAAKIHYAYERNRAVNWQHDVDNYMWLVDAGTGSSVFLDGWNPNYTAQFVGFFLEFGW